jgi:hypothetical protein
LKPAQANSSQEPILKKPNTKMGWWSGSRCRSWIQSTTKSHTHTKSTPTYFSSLGVEDS